MISLSSENLIFHDGRTYYFYKQYKTLTTKSKIKFKPNPEYRLMDQVREVLRYYHYAYKTEQSYCSWILEYIKFYGGTIHPKDMGKNEVERFLSYLTEKRNAAAATQEQALNALILFNMALSFE